MPKHRYVHQFIKGSTVRETRKIDEDGPDEPENYERRHLVHGRVVSEEVWKEECDRQQGISGIPYTSGYMEKL